MLWTDTHAYIYRDKGASKGKDKTCNDEGMRIPVEERRSVLPRAVAVQELGPTWHLYRHVSLPGMEDVIPNKPLSKRAIASDSTAATAPLTAANLQVHSPFLTSKTSNWETLSQEGYEDLASPTDDELEQAAARADVLITMAQDCAAALQKDLVTTLFLVDSGCGCNLVRLDKVRHLKKFFYDADPPMTFNTANGPIPATKMVDLPCPGAPFGVLSCYILK